MKLATWNINSLTVRLPQVVDWLAANPVDVLCLQELKLSDDKFPHEALLAAGYQSAVFGQKTYNGVAILSRTPLRDVVEQHSGLRRRAVARDRRDARHVPPVRCAWSTAISSTARSRAARSSNTRCAGCRRCTTGCADELAAHPELAVLGDFNVTAEDRDSWDPEGLRETIHHTTQERAHFQALLQLGLHDGYRLFEQPEKTYSWWDYREFAFRRNRGLRIDYILVSEALKPRVLACSIDKAPRKNERPSDHTPVVLELKD